MSDERLQILKMVAEGKISPEEAAKLIEAVEVPQPAPAGPKATHLRVKWSEGGKSKNFSVGLGFATWVLNGVGALDITTRSLTLNKELLLDAMIKGVVGKVFEAEEEGRRIEIWLDA